MTAIVIDKDENGLKAWKAAHGQGEPPQQTVAYRPMPGRILAAPIDAVKVTKGGIQLPEIYEQKVPKRATVIAVGEPTGVAKTCACMMLSPGDVIWVLEYAGNPIKIDGEVYRDYRQDEVYGMEARRE